jgi:hypothetical protein
MSKKGTTGVSGCSFGRGLQVGYKKAGFMVDGWTLLYRFKEEGGVGNMVFDAEAIVSLEIRKSKNSVPF